MTGSTSKGKPKNKIGDELKAFVVERLAAFDTPSEVEAALMEEFGVKLPRQNVECYDPTKRAGAKLSEKWRTLFFAHRKSFIEDAATHVPIANKTVRLRELQRAYDALKRRELWTDAVAVLERAAKEMGGVYTNRKELTGARGSPLQFENLSDEQLDRQLQQTLAEIREALVSKDASHGNTGSPGAA